MSERRRLAAKLRSIMPEESVIDVVEHAKMIAADVLRARSSAASRLHVREIARDLLHDLHPRRNDEGLQGKPRDDHR